MSKFKLKNFRRKTRPLEEVHSAYADVCTRIGDKEFQIKILQQSLKSLYSQAETAMKEVQAIKLKESAALPKPEANPAV